MGPQSLRGVVSDSWTLLLLYGMIVNLVYCCTYINVCHVDAAWRNAIFKTTQKSNECNDV